MASAQTPQQGKAIHTWKELLGLQGVLLGLPLGLQVNTKGSNKNSFQVQGTVDNEKHLIDTTGKKRHYIF